MVWRVCQLPCEPIVFCCHSLSHSPFSLQTMDVLNLADPEASSWLEAQLPQLHLLLGDSVARDSMMGSRIRDDEFLSRTKGGDSWCSLHRDLQDHIHAWDRETSAAGRRRGAAVVWMSGNDIYNKFSGLSSYSEDKLMSLADLARDTTESLLGITEKVIVLGPLPRLSGEVSGARWERTSAFHLERRLLHQLPQEVCFVPLGRQLTKMWAGRHSCF